MYDEEYLYYQETKGTYGSLYSNGSWFVYPLFYSKEFAFKLFEFYGVVWLEKYKRKSSLNTSFRVRVLTSDDLNTLKSCAINCGYKVDWDNFTTAYKIMSNCEKAGYPLVQNMDFCAATKVKNFLEVQVNQYLVRIIFK